MVATHETFDFDQLSFAAQTKPNRAGGKYATVGYGPAKEQVHFQLGASPKDALRCAFGLDESDKEPGKKYVKLELTEDTHEFIEKLESTLVQSAEANSVAWFKKTHSSAVLESRLTSNIKPQKDDRPDCVKLKVEEHGKTPTVVLVSTWKGHKLVPKEPVQGTLDDLTQGAMIVPIVKVQGGVWFMNEGKSFGMSLGASVLWVIKAEGAPSSASSGTLTFEMGDVEMTDAEEDGE